MKRVIIFLLSLAFIFVSCTNNVYIDDEIDSPVVKKNIWRVESVYFETANEAITYIINQHQSRSVAAKTDDESRTVVLTRPVLAENSDGIEDSSSDYVEDESLRGNITVPVAFTGSLTIDFGGYRYDFANSNEAFFVIEGGDNVYIYNGQSVIFNEASHTPYAIAVNSDTVTIDEHLIDDRRVDNKLIYVGEEGHLRIENTTDTLSGEVAVVTDGTNGGVIDITNSSVTFTDIYTKYKNADGTISDTIDDSITISDSARTKINIYSGNVIIENINKKDDYYNPTTDSIYDKAYLNIIGTRENTTIGSRHEVYSVVDKAIEKSDGDAVHEVVHDMVHYSFVAATCISDGHREYWTCDGSTDCRGRYYTKEDASEWVEDYSELVLPMDPNAHSIEHIEAKGETCTEDGNIEYWHCTLCDKYFSDETLKVVITKESTVIPHHTIKTEWEYDIESHWHVCEKDGNKVYVEAHTWGEWQTKKTNTVTQVYAECSICKAKKVAPREEYLVYNIGFGELQLKAIEDTPRGDFYVNNQVVEDGAKIRVNESSVEVVFKPWLNSNTEYNATSDLYCNGKKTTLTGAKDSEGKYTVSFTLSDTREYTLNIQLETQGGNLGFGCTIQR